MNCCNGNCQQGRACIAASTCPHCKGAHRLSQCPTWRPTGGRFLAFLLCAVLSACGGGSGAPSAVQAPTLAAVPTPARPVVYVALVLGQSNAAGRAEVQRLPAPYVANPAKVRIYQKDFANLAADNGSWKAYSAGFTSNTDGSPLHHFGPELALSQKIVKDTGNEVYIIKAAFGGTALTPGIPTYAPGNWTEIAGALAIDQYFVPAMRDLRAARPDADIKFLGVVWWQGENDAGAGVTGADYGVRFAAFKARVDSAISSQFTGYPWAIVGLSYMRTPQEADINRVKCAQAGGNYISTMQYPSKMALTVPQRGALLTGSQDDEHSSYIGQVAVGEKAAAIMMGKSSNEECPL